MTFIFFFFDKYNCIMTWKIGSNLEFPTPACGLPITLLALLQEEPTTYMCGHSSQPIQVLYRFYSCIGINNYLNKKKSNLKNMRKREEWRERVCVHVWVCAVWPIDPHSSCPVLATCFRGCPVATFSLAPPHRTQSPQAEGSCLKLAQGSPIKPGPWNALLKQTPAHL